MACHNCEDNINPCADPCNPNPCYQDCGCLNPTTFPCITNPGLGLDNIGVTNNMNGSQVLEAIDSAVGALQDALANAGENGDLALDEKVKVSANDTTGGFLTDKITTDGTVKKSTQTLGANEKLRLVVDPSKLISTDDPNQLGLGSDGKLRVYVPTGEEDVVYIQEGAGITLNGTGTEEDPIVISSNPSISVARSCFDGVWRNVTLVDSPLVDVNYITGQPQYRIRFDGTIEFKGSATFTVSFGAYSNTTRKYTIQLGAIGSTCLTIGELAGVADLKNVSYIDGPQASSDQIVQQYGYIIRKSTQNIMVEFQSAFTNPTTKQIVVNFDGVISHPNLS
jgi:hypothetical protein